MSAGITLTGAASAIGIAAGVNALTGGGITNALGLSGSATPSTAAGSATAVANPLAPYQANLAAQYAGYLQQGNTVDPTKLPGYSQFQSEVLNPALQATQRASAATGQFQSGNEQIALQQTGQNAYSTFMNNYLGQLYSGATGNAATGAQFGANQLAQSNANVLSGAGMVMQGLSGLGSSTSNPISTYGSGVGSLMGQAGYVDTSGMAGSGGIGD